MQIQVTEGNPYPIGVSYIKDEINFSFLCADKDCGLILYKKEDFSEIKRIPFPEQGAAGSVHFMCIQGIDREKTVYRYYVGNREVIDDFAHCYPEDREYGEARTSLQYCGFLNPGYDWEEETSPQLSYEESVGYCLHVRGFTKHSSSKVPIRQRGTFQGIITKIPYLKELGITTLELQPAYEFDELEPKDFMMSAYARIALDRENRPVNPEYSLNYWGYVLGKYYSPKNAYAAGKDPCTEFRDLVKTLHRNRMELIMQFYFPENYPYQYILEILRFWVLQYHIDGFHLKGSNLPVTMLMTDPGLTGKKIWLEQDIQRTVEKTPYSCDIEAAEYGSVYRDELRKFLKGDEGSLSPALYQMREKTGNYGRINYLSNYDGLTLMDTVSYDRKHNENNGEFNKDGSDYNFSWNCGEEGKSRKRAVRALRIKQIKNALCMLFSSQGTPLIFMGDEFGNTQEGNNNPYCQDNEITWLNWRLLKTNEKIYDFTRKMILFRQKFPVLHMKNGMRLMDYRAYGFPDMSYHGDEAWHPAMANYIRHIGIMYCCRYAQEHAGERFLYLAVNMHWEDHEFGLPKIADGLKWKVLFSTEEREEDGESGFDKKIKVPARSITVLTGIEE